MSICSGIARQRGMTLLELLVALFIFALAAGGMLRLLGEQGRHNVVLSERYLAELVAHNHLVDLHLLNGWPALGHRGQSVSMAGLSLQLREQVQNTDNPLVRRVTVEVVNGSEQVLARLDAFMGPSP